MSGNDQFGTFGLDEEEDMLRTITAVPQANFHTFDMDWFNPSAFAPVEPFTGGSAQSDLRNLPADREINYFTLQNVISGIEHASGHEEQPPRDYLSGLTTLLTPNDLGNPGSSGSAYPTPRQVQPEEEPRTEASNDEPSRFVTSQVSHLLTFSSPLLMKEGDPCIVGDTQQ